MSTQTRTDSWWMGYIAAEVGSFLAGLRDVASLRSAYREFYRSEQVQTDAEFRKWLPAPTKRKLNVKG